MRDVIRSSDPDIRGSLPASRRAARRARRLASQTGTPLYVLIAGRVVNLNARIRRASRPKKEERTG
jgi:hypothetical protein